MNRKRFAVLVAGALMLVSCSRSPEQRTSSAEAERATPPAAPIAPEKPAVPSTGTYKVRFDTTKGPIVVEVHRDWAPIGAQRFEELVKAGFFDGARFFRVVPNFVIQFGLAADPALTKRFDRAIDDDPVRQTNRVGSLSFATAGPNTRTSQIFINLRSNQQLDGDGFAPFAQIIEGMEVVEKINDEYREQPDQGAITAQGNAYLTKNFPRLDYIRKATIL
jgi:peptidyl-prolyl cis-trans isomerase A (cyclophilin A)